MYQPFRASWQTVIRPCTPFPPPPLRFRTAGFPQYGSKRAVSRDLRCSGNLYAATVEISSVRVYSVVGLLSNRHAWPLTRPTRPVALGSASGCSVRQPHRLLRPHPSFCGPRRVYVLIPAATRPAEVPQFTLPELDSVPPSLLRWFQDADRRVCAPDLAFTHPVGVRQPQAAHRTTCGSVNEAATFA